MKRHLWIALAMLLNGCQVDPYTHVPNWSSTDWYHAGVEDAMSGSALKDNTALAQTWNDPEVNRAQYLKGYAEGQQKTCEPGFAYAMGVAGKSFPASCDTVANASQLHAAWQKGADENLSTTRLN